MQKPHKMDRRSFLKLAGLTAVAGAVPVLSPAIGLASLDRDHKVAQETRMMMGTLVAITVVDGSAQRAQDALEKAFQRMDSLVPVFDRHNPGGLLTALNQEGSLSEIPPDLAQVWEFSRQMHSQTGGAFDPSVAPLVDLCKDSFAATGKPPAPEALHQALGLVGAAGWREGRLVLTKTGAAVTLDGVAKGFLVDRGLEAAAAAGAKHVLINAGGDIGVLGDRAGRPWRVAVADPSDPQAPLMTFSMQTGAVATSGNYEVFFDREKLYHHIINPATGLSPALDVSSSVRAPSAALADALSTACFVMKPVEAQAYLQKRPHLEGLIITRSGQRFATGGFQA
ncbi:MAG: FAD:protein FMN transferase [Deltaproteobacteria bacterium]|nr:FAD:protein FMN transferase [Deltaproteobacteria bacterium]